MFLFILGVFLIPYGVVTTALLYPNEMRISESLEGVFFKPILTLYGELFLSEYTTYDFNDPLNGCAATSKLGFLTNSQGIRGRFWPRSYVHVALFVSCLKNQFKISNLQTENEDYSGFEFVIETELLKNFTVNWDQNIKNRKLDCNGIARHEIELAAFYLANYDCEYS